MPRKENKNGFSVVPPFIPITRHLHLKKTQPLSDDKQAVVDKLRELLEKAEAGNLHGFCFSVAHDDQTYEADCVGTYDKFPTDAIGPVEVLKLKLTRKALDEQWLQNNS